MVQQGGEGGAASAMPLQTWPLLLGMVFQWACSVHAHAALHIAGRWLSRRGHLTTTMLLLNPLTLSPTAGPGRSGPPSLPRRAASRRTAQRQTPSRVGAGGSMRVMFDLVAGLQDRAMACSS